MPKNILSYKKITNIIPEKIKSYFSFLGWFISDSIWRYKSSSLFILVVGFLGIIFQVQVFFIITYYARHFSSGEIITMAGYSFDPRTSLSLLTIGSLFVAVSLSLSALCTYFYKKHGLKIARLYEEFCSQRVFCLLGEKENIFSIEGNAPEINTYLARLARIDARFCGRFLRTLFMLVIPGLTFILAVIVLFYLEHLLTTSIAVILIFYSYFQYKTSKAGAFHSAKYDKVLPVSGDEYRKLLKHFKHQFPGVSDTKFVNKALSSGPIKRELDAYESRLRIPFDSELVSGIFMAIIIGLIIIAMGANIMQDKSGWGKLLVYLLALQYAMINLRASFAFITSANRFYPQARRHFQFVNPPKDNDFRECPPQEAYEVTITSGNSENLLKSGTNSVSLARGNRLALVLKTKLNYYTLPEIINLLMGSSKQTVKSALNSSQIVISDHSCPYRSLRQLLNLEPNAKWTDLKNYFPDEQTWRNFTEQFPPELNKQINQKLWENIDAGNKFLLSLIAAANSNSQWVMIDAAGLIPLDLKTAARFLDLLQNKILVLVFSKNLGKVGCYGESSVIVADGKKLLGIGTPEWFSSTRKQIKEIWSSLSEKEDAVKSQEEDDMEVD